MLEKRLRFSLSEFEVDPSGVEMFIRLGVEAQSGSFSGASTCVVRERDLVAFLDGVRRLAAASPGDAQLVGGWGKGGTGFALSCFSAGRAGHLEGRVVLNDPSDLAHTDRLDAFFRTEPASLRRFGEDLQDALAARRDTSVSLYVVGGPAV